MIILRQEFPGDISSPPSVLEIRIDSTELTASALVDYFRQFMLATGYHATTVNDVLGEQ
jgi:hypothetical protein